MQDDLARKSKREKRRALLEKAKQRERMRLEMNVPNDTGNYISEEGLFSIRTLRTHAVREWAPHAGRALDQAPVHVVGC